MTNPRTRALLTLARAKAATSDNNAHADHAAQTALLALLAAWFASPNSITATELPPGLIDALVAIGIDHKVAVQVGEMVAVKPLPGRSRAGAPSKTSDMSARARLASEEPRLRAEYVLAAARCLTVAIQGDNYDQAVRNEQRYLDAHVAAGQNRQRAAKRVDRVSEQTPVMVWRTAGDDRVTPECAAMEGRLFTVKNPPGIYPGAVHPRCRCRAEPHGQGPHMDWATSGIPV